VGSVPFGFTLTADKKTLLRNEAEQAIALPFVVRRPYFCLRSENFYNLRSSTAETGQIQLAIRGPRPQNVDCRNECSAADALSHPAFNTSKPSSNTDAFVSPGEKGHPLWWPLHTIRTR
jgi:hypothetical protein